MAVIEGWISPVGEPFITHLLGPSLPQLDFLIDTGFNGDLVLPRHLIDGLGLEAIGQISAELGDGTAFACPLFLLSVSWLGQEQDVEVLATRGRVAILGTQLLRGCRLDIDFVRGHLRIVSPEA